MSLPEVHPRQTSTFPQLSSSINQKTPGFHENELKWKTILHAFDVASTEACSESKTAAAITKHTARQLLGKK